MNIILKQYFERLNWLANPSGLKYHIYKRDNCSNMPFSVHFQFTDQLNKTRNSWGAGRTEDEAFGKSLMEMIERMYFQNLSPFVYNKFKGFFKKSSTVFELSKLYGIPVSNLHPSNTNGVAAHLSTQGAKLAAKNELIERHTILYVILKKIPPFYKQYKILGKDRKCSFYFWYGPNKRIVSIGAYSTDGGAYFSSGCGNHLTDAQLKAELELSSFLYLDDVKRDKSQIIKDDVQSFNLYHRFSGDSSAIDFMESGIREEELPDLDERYFYYTLIPKPLAFKGLLEIPVVRVIHPDAQQLFFDNWDHRYLNPRLFDQRFELPNFPHVIA